MARNAGGWLAAALMASGALIPNACRASYEDDVRQGFAALKNKEYERAIACFTEAIRSKPNSSDAFAARGGVYAQMRQFAHAFDDFDRAVGLDPQSPFALFGRGKCRREFADFDRAIADLTESIRLDATQAYALSARGDCYLAMGEYGKAVADLSEAIRLDPTGTPRVLTRGAAYFFLGDYDKALADCDEVIAAGQKDDVKNAYRIRGHIYRIKKDYAKALAEFESSLRMDGNDGSAYACLAYLWATSSDPRVRDGAKALEYARKACDMTGHKDAFCLMALAAALAEVGDCEEAVRQLQAALDRPGPWYSLQREEASRQMKAYKAGKPYHDE
jgi:tetratricopeptide (TPR) repeat protein